MSIYDLTYSLVHIPSYYLRLKVNIHLLFCFFWRFIVVYKQVFFTSFCLGCVSSIEFLPLNILRSSSFSYLLVQSVGQDYFNLCTCYRTSVEDRRLFRSLVPVERARNFLIEYLISILSCQGGEGKGSFRVGKLD